MATMTRKGTLKQTREPSGPAFVIIEHGCKPSKTASTDRSRPVLMNGFLRKKGNEWELLTSDSYSMACLRVRVECAEGDAPQEGAIPIAALRHAEKQGAFRITTEHVEPCDQFGRSSDVLYRRSDDPTPPNWEKILDERKAPEKPFRVGLNTKLLRNVAEAIGSDSVVLEFDAKNALRPIGVSTKSGNGREGLLMPVRIVD